MFRSLPLLVVFSIGLFFGIQGDDETEKSITGRIIHRGSEKIEERVEVQVELRDITVMDMQSKLINSVIINNVQSFPISYTLTYNSSAMDPSNRYSLKARLTSSNGTLLYISDTYVPVELNTLNINSIDIPVIRVNRSEEFDEKKQKPNKKCRKLRCTSKISKCKYGLVKSKGCPTCQCHNPCRNYSKKKSICNSRETCVIQKAADGKFDAICLKKKVHSKNKPNVYLINKRRVNKKNKDSKPKKSNRKQKKKSNRKQKKKPNRYYLTSQE